jgi:phytanoyl-CoA hydroxylase
MPATAVPTNEAGLNTESTIKLERILEPDQRAYWEANGYLVLPGFYAEADLERVERCYAHAWSKLPDYIVVDILETRRRCYMSQTTEAERAARFVKTNDLYLNYPDVRGAALDLRMVRVLTELLGDRPVMCHSLNFKRSSQQPVHVDSIYMSPRTPSRLVATWIALEDSRPDAGQLFYYPGSHRIPPFVFAPDGRRASQSPEDQGRWNEYIHAQIEQRGLTPSTFAARRGDVLIWHSELAHGGQAVTNPEATRRSLVSHFWGEADCREAGEPMEALNGGFWIHRPSHPVPGLPQRLGPDDAMAEPEAKGVPVNGHGLMERLSSLFRR